MLDFIKINQVLSNHYFLLRDKISKFDFIFIDGDHRYSQVVKDVRNSYNVLKPGGILAGHDFEKFKEDIKFDIEPYIEQDTYENMHLGVIKAVSEELEGVQREGRIWWTRKAG